MCIQEESVNKPVKTSEKEDPKQLIRIKSSLMPSNPNSKGSVARWGTELIQPKAFHIKKRQNQ